MLRPMSSSGRKSTKALSEENARLRSDLASVTQKLEAIQKSLSLTHLLNNPVQVTRDERAMRGLPPDDKHGIVTLTPNGVILSATPQFLDMTQSSATGVVGRSFFDFVRLGCNEQFFDFLHQCLEGTARVNISLVNRTGVEIPAALTGRPFSIDGKVAIALDFNAPPGRRKPGKSSPVSERSVQAPPDFANDVVWEFNAATDEVWRSEGLAELLGYPPNGVRPTMDWWRRNIHPDDRSRVFLELDKILRTGQGSFRQAYRVRKADGSYAEVSNRAVAIRDEQTRTVRLIGSIVDVTEENKAQAAQREISKKILQAQEQERQRVARELHDGVNQILSSSSYRLNYLEQQISAHDISLGQKVLQAKELVEKAMSEVRLISRNLRPSELDDLGLNSALRTLCNDFKDRTGIKIKVSSEDFARNLSPNVEMTIYRIAQEALNNIEKHAHATAVRLSLKADEDAFITLKIRDNGFGFDPDTVRKSAKGGWGLDNMRERASLYHGKVTLLSAPQKGTEVILTIPVT